MSEITDKPTESILKEISILNADLNKCIPALGKDKNVLIATWNLRAFGDLTEKWTAEKNDSPSRDLQSLLCIGEIIKRFDIIAIQEVKGNIKCLRHLMKYLGDSYSFIMTDVTAGHAGNDERLAFLFNNKKVQLSGLACEIVLPEELLQQNVKSDALARQFARSPYAVSFKVAGKTFVLLTLHVVYGDNKTERIKELAAIAKWIADWSKELNDWGHSLITLGDFNIDRYNDKAFQAFTSTGLYTPPDMQNTPRTISNSVNFYDQVAWFNDKNANPQINLKYNKGGSYNFKDTVLISRKYSCTQLSFRISDHLPLWTEFLA